MTTTDRPTASLWERLRSLATMASVLPVDHVYRRMIDAEVSKLERLLHDVLNHGIDRRPPIDCEDG